MATNAGIKELGQQCVAIIVQLLLNTYILISLNKLHVRWVAMKWKFWCHSGFISIWESIKGVDVCLPHPFHPPHRLYSVPGCLFI